MCLLSIRAHSRFSSRADHLGCSIFVNDLVKGSFFKSFHYVRGKKDKLTKAPCWLPVCMGLDGYSLVEGEIFDKVNTHSILRLSGAGVDKHSKEKS